VAARAGGLARGSRAVEESGRGVLVLDFAGLRFMTDPTFDPPGPQPRGLVKLVGPAVRADDVGRIDVILLSHDHHADNLDAAGRAFLARARRVLTTSEGAKRLGDRLALIEPGASVTV
jgi:L-ascorbate metabolism protein UlaG (beta-lactamase superfamily)